MNIELKFLNKAIEEKNYISFMYEGKNLKNEKPLKLDNETLYTNTGKYTYSKVSKLTILKNRF